MTKFTVSLLIALPIILVIISVLRSFSAAVASLPF